MNNSNKNHSLGTCFVLVTMPSLYKLSHLVNFNSYNYNFISLADKETEVQGHIAST